MTLKVGIDLGGHTITAAAALGNNAPCFAAKIAKATPSSRNLDEIVKCLSEMVAALSPAGKIAAVGVGVPGFVETDRRRIARLTNFHALEKVEFARLLEGGLKKLGIDAPVLLENDANCAALGEGMCGVAAGLRDFVVFTLGTGIGSGIVCGGRLLCGSHGMAGEAGHVPVTGSAERCGCGGVGHMERSASADWLEKAAVAAGLPGDFKTIWRRRKDAAAAALLEPALDSLARGIAAVMVVTDPELVILSGGMSRAEGLAEEMEPRVLAYLPAPFRPEFKLEISKLGSDAALWGALSLYKEGSC